MLIKALCDYYDLLAENGNVLPEGFSNVKIHYLISLTETGQMDELIQYQNKEIVPAAKGKTKEKWVPREVVMPERTEKPGIDSNMIEHRALYIFGLNFNGDGFTPEDKTGKARKSHEAFVNANLKFIEDLDSPAINAYRNFLLNWKPEEETENAALLGLGKEYGKVSFGFCLTGYPDQLLTEDPQMKQRWETIFSQRKDEAETIAQCAVSGEPAPISRIHNKIRGVYGGLATGNVLISFKNTSENSYGNEQSYNSNISQEVMKKYTEALNLLLGSANHRLKLDDVTIVFWAMDTKEVCEENFLAFLNTQSSKMDASETDHMLKELLKDGKKGKIRTQRLQSLDTIGPNVDFYMVGLKPNSSRLSVKFIYRKRYADMLWNIARFQEDLQTSRAFRAVSIVRIRKELLAPKSKSEKINPALLTKLFEAVVYGGNYPTALLETAVRRVKADGDSKINGVRAGLIKACLNRNYIKEEFDVALDKENCGAAYLCGRLFAVMQKLQEDASKAKLNRTIKDGYFASASSRPAIVFPKLLRLAQNHLNKTNSEVFYNKLIGEIMDKMGGEFPETLLLQDQGRFVIGYYQQYQSFFEKREKVETVEVEGNENDAK